MCRTHGTRSAPPGIFVGTWTYRIPFMRGNRSVVDRLASGWEVSGIYRYQSGSPLTITGTTPTGGRRGNSTRGQFRGPAYTLWDITIRKQIPIKGSVRGQIEATFYNAFNRLNYRSPATNLSGAGFGSISPAAPPRQVQLGFRVNF